MKHPVLLKLNSTEEVAVCISSTKIARGKGGGVSSPLYGASAQISMVSACGKLRLFLRVERKGCTAHFISKQDCLSISVPLR